MNESQKDMHWILRHAMLISLAVALFWSIWSFFAPVPSWTFWLSLTNETTFAWELSRWWDIPCIFLGLAIWGFMLNSIIRANNLDTPQSLGFACIAAVGVLMFFMGAFAHFVIFLGAILVVLFAVGVVMFFHFCWALVRPLFSEVTLKESVTSFFGVQDINS